MNDWPSLPNSKRLAELIAATPCPTCDGQGAIIHPELESGEDYRSCPDCNGTGLAPAASGKSKAINERTMETVRVHMGSIHDDKSWVLVKTEWQRIYKDKYEDKAQYWFCPAPSCGELFAELEDDIGLRTTFADYGIPDGWMAWTPNLKEQAPTPADALILLLIAVKEAK